MTRLQDSQTRSREMNIPVATQKEIRWGVKGNMVISLAKEKHNRPEKTDITNKDMTRKRTRIKTMHLASP
jgi:hypothetical protein